MPEPRATRIELSFAPEVTTELWMGGADCAAGQPLLPADLRGAWVIDCANDMPEAYRAAAAVWLYRVFQDIEEPPPGYARIADLTASIAACLAGRANGQVTEHPATPPRRLYVLCTQGLNRSGLVTALLLRGLGLGGGAAIAHVCRARPGALNNLTFRRLVRDGGEGVSGSGYERMGRGPLRE